MRLKLLLLLCISSMFIFAQETNRPHLQVVDNPPGADLLYPQYPGGMDGVNNYIRQNMQYPQEALSQSISGSVAVKFVVEEDGTVNIESIQKSDHELLTAEATRLLQSMDNWKPATFNGEPTRLSLTHVIYFDLQ